VVATNITAKVKEFIIHDKLTTKRPSSTKLEAVNMHRSLLLYTFFHVNLREKELEWMFTGDEGF
jgi:hypothetical protein